MNFSLDIFKDLLYKKTMAGLSKQQREIIRDGTSEFPADKDVFIEAFKDQQSALTELDKTFRSKGKKRIFNEIQRIYSVWRKIEFDRNGLKIGYYKANSAKSKEQLVRIVRSCIENKIHPTRYFAYWSHAKDSANLNSSYHTLNYLSSDRCISVGITACVNTASSGKSKKSPALRRHSFHDCKETTRDILNKKFDISGYSDRNLSLVEKIAASLLAGKDTACSKEMKEMAKWLNENK